MSLALSSSRALSRVLSLSHFSRPPLSPGLPPSHHQGSTVSLLCFRGGVGNLYGNLGPSDEWLSEFLDKVKPAAAAPAPAAEPVAAE
mmetsp:Transcript_56251/g.155186  ORF Transcript_56251/g.155186 Transcript_56251/m.155186 type:complete len:87 (-) Transcript_56251:312-572(-)